MLGSSGAGGAFAARPSGGRGAGWRPAVSRTWSMVVPSRAAMARTGRPERMSGARGGGVGPRRQRGVVDGGAEPGGDGANGQAGADERVQVLGADAVGVRAWPGDASSPGEWRFPGDGLVDAGVGEQGAGLLVQAAGHRQILPA